MITAKLRIFIAVSVLLVFCCFVTACQSPATKEVPPKATPALEKPVAKTFSADDGSRYFSQGNFELALEALLYQIKKQPGDVNSRILAARAALKCNNPELVKEIVEPIIQSKTAGQNEALAWQYLAQSTMEQKDEESAKKIFADIRKRYKDDPDNLRAMVMHESNIYWKNKKYDQALKVMNELITLGNKAQIPGVLLQKALVLRDAGKIDESQKALKSILKKFGSNKTIANEARLHLARFLLQDKKKDEALKLIDQAGKKGADPKQVANLLLDIARKADKEQAEKLFFEVIKRFAKDIVILNTARCDLSTLYMKNKQLEKAAKYLALVVKESPDDKQKQWAKDSLDEIKLTLSQAK